MFIRGLTGGTYCTRVLRLGYKELRDSVRYGMGGLRLHAALALNLDMQDFECVVSATRTP